MIDYEFINDIGDIWRYQTFYPPTEKDRTILQTFRELGCHELYKN